MTGIIVAVHLLAAGVWFGGSTALVFVGVPAIRTLEGEPRGRAMKALGQEAKTTMNDDADNLTNESTDARVETALLQRVLDLHPARMTAAREWPWNRHSTEIIRGK